MYFLIFLLLVKIYVSFIKTAEGYSIFNKFHMTLYMIKRVWRTLYSCEYIYEEINKHKKLCEKEWEKENTFLSN